MKAPNFAYCRPASLDEALKILEAQGEGAVPLAGGQSLLATLNMRLSAPELLVDIGDLSELKGLSVDGDVVRIGALARHSEVLESPLIRSKLPLLSEAVRHVGHVAIRNRGTFGGSLAYADPAAELPACTVALGGTVVVASRTARREVAAAQFFKGLLSTDLKPEELILEIRLPVQKDNQAWAFAELSRRHGDFAIAGLAAIAGSVDRGVTDARFVYFGCADRPRPAEAVGAVLRGRRLPLGETDWPGLGQAIEADVDPVDSPGWKASTKTRLAMALTRRVLHRLDAQLIQ